MNNNNTLEGKVALVTGGISGTGKATGASLVVDGGVIGG